MNGQALINDGRKFRIEHKPLKDIASGGEGKVSLWKNKSTGRLIAVKEPLMDHPGIKKSLKEEIASMKKLGQHPHIVGFLGAAGDWGKLSPAIFYVFCELGCVHDYTERLLKGGISIPEVTIWKFILDMTKGLDYLHNGFDVPYVHGDLKPGNILVSRSPGDDATLPIMPTFKLADISHLTPYIASSRIYQPFRGTWEYAPPASERTRLIPPIDIWAIGSSLQTLAWGIIPVKSMQATKRKLRARGYNPTDKQIRDLRNHGDYRSTQLPFVWRPLNASGEEQLNMYDMDNEFPPYSDALNYWYAMCLNENPKARVTAKILKECYIPLAEHQIKMYAARERRDSAIKKFVGDSSKGRKTVEGKDCASEEQGWPSEESRCGKEGSIVR
ncbi:kinase-like protein [Lentithecium fluviatile CBS 122367]|uniref:Kinase-like protein n=1 Tax=Lentithecium fluviatile CBS 122367 TaxID=1168545 RepID=A0A6G1JG12_9PLEO|nr:kinase-like protein [Lentithecium fluviatile CBS 122367]